MRDVEARDRTFRFAVPNDPNWKRVRRHWGEPRFYVAAVTPEQHPNPRIYSRHEFPADRGALCDVGVSLQGASGALRGDIVVVSAYATKDRLFGVALHQDFDRYVTAAAICAGAAALIGAALIGLSRRRKNLGGA
jgi:hypothetical protein